MEAANKIAIITDTCCDLPQEYLKEYPIFCVPLVVTSGTESYRDNIDITVETIYARPVSYTHLTLPTTSRV